MCGIAGLFYRDGSHEVTETDLRRMLGAIRHRGPDEFGILLDANLGLGSARLSIIDLESGSQPIANEDKTLWIVFNGEIFNYLELRVELESLGHQFLTSTDTEVILHLFEELGPNCLKKLNGQFAIAIWNRTNRQLFLARDRLGVRPLFYTKTQTIIFGSEIKSILATGYVAPELDTGVIAQVFSFWSPISPKTAFHGIVELPPGHFLMADQDSITVQSYWQNQFPEIDYPTLSRHQEQELVDEFRALLIDACKIRLRADVAVGAYLSGGLDSSTIASIIQGYTQNKLVTFSIAFDDPRFDESGYQREMAEFLGTNHHVIQATHAEIGEIFPEVIWHTESPLMRTSPAPMFLLSKLVSNHGFKVVLTGEGADEFQAGYDIFKESKIRRFCAKQPFSKSRSQLFQRLYPDITGLSGNDPKFLSAFFSGENESLSAPFYSHSIRWRNNRRTLRFFKDDLLASSEFQASSLAQPDLPSGFMRWEPLARAQHLEINLFLSQYLLSSQGDRMGMAHSVEGRYPFLDFRLVEFCNNLHPKMKLRGLREKWLLKKAAAEWLPDSILRRPKQPYRAPIQHSFFNNRTPDYVTELLSERCIRATGIFKHEATNRLVNKIQQHLPLGETDNMALAGILSTQLLDHLFIKNFRAPSPLKENDPVKICQLNQFHP